MPRKIYVTDVALCQREVEVPDACPKCGESTAEHMVFWTLSSADTVVDAESMQVGVGTVGEECFTLRALCIACETVLAAGIQAEYAQNEIPQRLRDVLREYAEMKEFAVDGKED